MPVTQAYFRSKKLKNYDIAGPETVYEAEAEDIPIIIPIMEKFSLEKEAETIEVDYPDEIPVVNPVLSTFNYEKSHSHMGMDTV